MTAIDKLLTHPVTIKHTQPGDDSLYLVHGELVAFDETGALLRQGIAGKFTFVPAANIVLIEKQV